jgi:hypothetical protein
VNTAPDLKRDRERRLLNQNAFPFSFVKCSCERGCLVCAYTGLVSRAESKQVGHPAPAPARARRPLKGGSAVEAVGVSKGQDTAGAPAPESTGLSADGRAPQ